ncbi:hypothetical protein P7C73_g5516, partial [Tremellales sp. Uapishka_1]
MDDEDNDYELERQKTIAENRALLDSLGLDSGGSSKLNIASKSIVKPKAKAGRPLKRKAAPGIEKAEGPRRRSGRIAGLEVDGEESKEKIAWEVQEREAVRIVNRKIREQVMAVGEMVEETPEWLIPQLDGYLNEISELENPRSFPPSTGKESYAEKDTKKEGLARDVSRLRDAMKGMCLVANAKVTMDRVYSMAVHPEKTKTLVLVGDKQGMLGIWDAMGPSGRSGGEEDESGDEDEDEGVGRIWRVQAHARSAITSLKVEPINGAGVSRQSTVKEVSAWLTSLAGLYVLVRLLAPASRLPYREIDREVCI